MNIPDEFNVPQAASHLNMSEEPVRRNIRSKRLSSLRRGATWHQPCVGSLFLTSTPGITLDVLLETLAEDTWENLREAKPLCIRFGEETITDTLMLELRRKGFTVFKQTSLHDEAKYGTDFECWVGSDSTGWVGYAIQAKKLNFRTGTYQTLGHVVKGPREEANRYIEGICKEARHGCKVMPL